MATKNHWVEDRCAKAFWGQHELAPFRRLVADTIDWAAPAPGEAWLDLGCGGGILSRALWVKTGGTAQIVGVDCAAANANKYAALRGALGRGAEDGPRFVCHDFSAGLAQFADATFDHAVSGLSISYAESYDGAAGRWTAEAYQRVLAEVFRVIRPGGRFVFSVNVPEPSWVKVGLYSLGGVIRSPRPLLFLKNAWRMAAYGGWLKREARRGRFHYRPREEVVDRLHLAGFTSIDCRLSYAGQAFVFRAFKPAVGGVGHAR